GVDPDRAGLDKALPPRGGGVVKLTVQRGERVDAEQALAVVDSSDLSTAYAEYDRAKVLLDLARKTRDRFRDLAKIGGAAIKEQLQAEAEYGTAEGGVERGGARGREGGGPVAGAGGARGVTG